MSTLEHARSGSANQCLKERSVSVRAEDDVIGATTFRLLKNHLHRLADYLHRIAANRRPQFAGTAVFSFRILLSQDGFERGMVA